MTEDVIQRLFANVRSFGWDERKRTSNRRVHGIDFEDVRGVLDGPAFIRRSDRYGEIRYQIFGIVDGREVAVACTIEDEICRLISARRARRDERRKFYGGLARQPAPGKD